MLKQGVPEQNIIEMAFDTFGNKKFRDPNAFYPFVVERLEATKGKRFVLLDEVQLLEDFAEVLIDLISMDDVDVYVTGSNAKMLSTDVVTEFRGRGRNIEMMPLTFAEFFSVYPGDKRDAYEEYATYGGLPAVLSENTPDRKARYLADLYNELKGRGFGPALQ